MPSLDPQIDELYQRPLSEFTAARNALAKTIGGDAGARIRRLAKPPAVPWAVNQLYWKARPVYDRLMESGRALRAAHVAALEGKAADVGSAGVAHREAIAEAVRRALRLANAASVSPDADALARTLDALSLAAAPPDHPGRLTEVLRPAGFEALTGVAPAAPGTSSQRAAPATPAAAPRSARDERRRAAEAKEAAREAAERRKRAEAAVKAAADALARAKAAETDARRALDQAQRDVRAAEAQLEAAERLRRDA
jgi:hypothetical protein